MNPSHLWLGTSKDNVQDGFKKGRITRRKCLTSKQVELVLSSKGSHTSVGKKIGVSRSTISRVRGGLYG